MTNKKEDLYAYIKELIENNVKKGSYVNELPEKFENKLLESIIEAALIGTETLEKICDTWKISFSDVYYILGWDAKIKQYKEKIINPDCLDTVGIKIEEGDYVYLFNGLQETKKWSFEKVTKGDNGNLYTVFQKYLGPVYTNIIETPSNWLMVLKNHDGLMVFDTDNINYNFKKGQ